MAVSRRLFLSSLLSLPAVIGKEKRRNPNAPLVEVLELKVERQVGEPVIAIDGRVQNIGNNEIKNFVIIFDIVAPDGSIPSRQRGPIDEDPFPPGAISEFHWRMRDEARGVEVRVSGVSRREVAVAVEKAGPYPIE